MTGLRRPGRQRQRGAALVVVVLLAAALSVAAGAVAHFALLEARSAAAATERVAVAAAADAGLELVTAALADAPGFDAVRAGTAPPPSSGTAACRVRGTLVDVVAQTRAFERRRASLPPPAGPGVWRPYLWGRTTELLGDLDGDRADQPWLVAWVRTDGAAGLGPDRLEIAVEACGAGGARAGAIAVVERRPGGTALAAVWPDVGLAAPG
jgi:hypothetical protein